MWEKEIKIIDGLGKLYPEFIDYDGYLIRYRRYRTSYFAKSAWLVWLCTDHLNQRIPSLEPFIAEGSKECAWGYYKEYFGIKE